MPDDVSVSTLGTYESGSRHCTVVRLIELCVALRARPDDLLGRLYDQVIGEPGGLLVNLPKLATCSEPELAPISRWAEHRVAQIINGTGPVYVMLSEAAMARMSELCGIEVRTLTRLVASVAT